MFNIFGDVGGQYEALKRLQAKMPKAKSIYVGDLNDRGWESRQVIEHVMNEPGAICLASNHGEMMVDWVLNGARKYGYECWLRNGGAATLSSYDVDFRVGSQLDAQKKIPKEHLAFLHNCPKIFETKDLIVTHAALSFNHDKIKDCLVDDGQYEFGDYVLWTRMPPQPRGKKFQVFGHNGGTMGLGWFTWNNAPAGEPQLTFHKGPSAPAGCYAACIDDSRKQVLTGMHWPTLEIFQEPF